MGKDTRMVQLYMNSVQISMISFAETENCVKWHMDTCLSVQNIQIGAVSFGMVHNVSKEDICFLWKNSCLLR